jgi:predicted outer membrane protein
MKVSAFVITGALLLSVAGASAQGINDAQIAKIVVTANQAVIDAVDKTLIPGAQNEEPKALLVKVRPAFVAHLEHAKKIQADLSK